MPHPFTMDGQVGIVAGLANHDSIAFGCAQALHEAGAEMLVTYANTKAERFVLPLATELGPQGIRVHAISAGPIHTRAPHARRVRTQGIR